MKVSQIFRTPSPCETSLYIINALDLAKFTSSMPIEERTHSPQMQLRGHPARPQTCAGFWKCKVSRIFWHSFYFLCMSARSHGPVSVAKLSIPRVRILLPTSQTWSWNSCYASTKMNPLIYKSKLLCDRQRIDCAKNRKSLFASLPKKPACFQVIQENAFESAQPLETLRRNVHFWLNTIMQLYANLFSRLQSPSKRPHFPSV